MQMGRWFGYRSGYLDVCRVFTTDTIVEFFLNVKIANEAMYQIFQEMYDRSDIPKILECTYYHQIQLKK